MDPYKLYGNMIWNSPIMLKKTLDSKGTASCIYKTNNNKVVAKVIKIDKYTRFYQKDIYKEYLIQDIAFVLGVAPEPISYKTGIYNNKMYSIIEMKFFKSTTLTDIYHNYINNKLSENDFTHIITKVYNNLSKLYNYGIIHNDLHSNNFLVDISNGKDPLIKIIDYGLSEKKDYIIADNDRDYIIKITSSFPYSYIDLKGLKIIQR